MKLYELTGAYLEAREVALQLAEGQTEQGLAEAQWTALAAGLKDAFESKVEAIAKLVQTLEAEAMAIGVEVNRLQGRRSAVERAGQWWRAYLLNEMAAAQIPKVRGTLFTVWLQVSPPSCEVTEESRVPEEWKEWRLFINRAAILEHFKATGELVPGVAIQADKQHLRIH